MEETHSTANRCEGELARLRAEVQSLRAQLEDSQETLRAIQEGAVDALVIDTPDGQRVFTLQGEEHPYRAVIEQMLEGAATLTPEGIIHYCNQRFAEMLKLPLERVMGGRMEDFVTPGDRVLLATMLREGGGRAELTLTAGDATDVSALVSAILLRDEGPAAFCLTIADLTERKRLETEIRGDEPRRIVTEAALFGTLMHYELYVGQPLVSDDAGQFKILGLLHALCWLHAERSIRKLVPLDPREQETIEHVRDAVWKYYQRLRAYRESPTSRRKAALERDFDRLFRWRTGFADLNEALRRIHEKRDDLLLVLERPEIPLHNNLSESDIREWAKKRKISAGTRSELGRRCRDTFVSLKKTCRKLGVSFWRYLQDRIRGLHEILALPELMRQAAQET